MQQYQAGALVTGAHVLPSAQEIIRICSGLLAYGCAVSGAMRIRRPWLFKDAGLVCAVCADLAGLIIVKSGRGSSATFAEGKGSSTVRKAVSSM